MRQKTLEEEARSVARVRKKQDTKELINLILQTPLNKGEVYQIDGEQDLKSFEKKNVDVQTRIFLQMAINASKGDKNSAEFLMKYGGHEPPKEQKIEMQLPTIVDDMSRDCAEEKKKDEPPIYEDSDDTDPEVIE